MSARIDKRDVLAALAPAAVLEHFGIAFRRAGTQLRTRSCPRCGERARDAVTIATAGSAWIDHAHGCSGDALDLVAGYAGLDTRRNFEQVVRLAAEIGGVLALDGQELERQRAELERKRRDEKVAAAARRARAEAAAPRIWQRLARASSVGLSYLASRKLGAARGDVRFGRRSICIPLRDATGRIVNVVGRRVDGGEPKVRGLASCGTLGTFGDVGKVGSTSGPIVVVEGVADFLSARLLWPERLVLGAHGAGRIPDVTAIACQLDDAAERGLLFVPHRDDDGTGVRQVERGIASAARVGVPVEVFTVVSDLNDLLCGRGGR